MVATGTRRGNHGNCKLLPRFCQGPRSRVTSGGLWGFNELKAHRRSPKKAGAGSSRLLQVSLAILNRDLADSAASPTMWRFTHAIDRTDSVAAHLAARRARAGCAGVVHPRRVRGTARPHAAAHR